MRKVILMMLLAAVCNSYAGTLTEAYELQERCGKHADEYFKKENGKTGIRNTDDGQAAASYTNHYNKKLNKCFYIETYISFPSNQKVDSSDMRSLIDINEKKEYGSYFMKLHDKGTFICNVEGKQCHSKDEWEALIKPFMEE